MDRRVHARRFMKLQWWTKSGVVLFQYLLWYPVGQDASALQYDFTKQRLASRTFPLNYRGGICAP